jgi:hypothetical protein
MRGNMNMAPYIKAQRLNHESEALVYFKHLHNDQHTVQKKGKLSAKTFDIFTCVKF